MIELLKVIAMLCQISAGDKPSMQTTPSIIRDYQNECHATYAACIIDAPTPERLLVCMKDRKK